MKLSTVIEGCALLFLVSCASVGVRAATERWGRSHEVRFESGEHSEVLVCFKREDRMLCFDFEAFHKALRDASAQQAESM